MKKQVLFFRNDDVRNVLDDSLKSITDLFIKHCIPITHCVEPGNVTRKVIDWLITLKIKYPHYIEITQHGFNHQLKAITKSGEFGGARNYQEQYKEIMQGKNIMDECFGKLWFKAFSFPYGSYNTYTLQALYDLDYKVISTGYKHSSKRMLLNKVGTMLHKKFLFGKPINYFNRNIPHFQLIELPTVINLTKQTLDANNSIQKSLEELTYEFVKKKNKFKTIGFLMHHRWWKEKDIETLDHFLTTLNKLLPIYSTYSTMENIYNG